MYYAFFHNTELNTLFQLIITKYYKITKLYEAVMNIPSSHHLGFGKKNYVKIYLSHPPEFIFYKKKIIIVALIAHRTPTLFHVSSLVI
jgi:hypothetical protein